VEWENARRQGRRRQVYRRMVGDVVVWITAAARRPRQTSKSAKMLQWINGVDDWTQRWRVVEMPHTSRFSPLQVRLTVPQARTSKVHECLKTIHCSVLSWRCLQTDVRDEVVCSWKTPSASQWRRTNQPWQVITLKLDWARLWTGPARHQHNKSITAARLCGRGLYPGNAGRSVTSVV